MARKKDASTMAMGSMIGALRKAKFDENIVYDLQSKQETVAYYSCRHRKRQSFAGFTAR
jgi:hypothetical protein